MPDIRWKKNARADLWDIVDYISDDNPDAAQALKDEIEAKAGELTRNPRMYQAGRVSGTREIVIRKNYILVYSGIFWYILKLRTRSRYCVCCMPLRSTRKPGLYAASIFVIFV